MTTSQLRQQIIGPCTPEQKAEAREILEGMREAVSPEEVWDHDPENFPNIECLPYNFYTWDTTDSEPTMSFEQFKQIVQK